MRRGNHGDRMAYRVEAKNMHCSVHEALFENEKNVDFQCSLEDSSDDG